MLFIYRLEFFSRIVIIFAINALFASHGGMSGKQKKKDIARDEHF